MTPSPGAEPGPHWWEASALTSAPSLLRIPHPSSSLLLLSPLHNPCSMTTAILSHLLFSLTLSVAHCPLFSGLNAADIYLKLHLVDPVLLNPDVS